MRRPFLAKEVAMTGFVFRSLRVPDHRRRKCAGFTLMEVLVTLAIMSILMLSITPSLRNFLYRVRLKGAVQELFFTLQHVRMNAIHSSARWAIDLSDTSCKVIDCGDNSCTTTADNRIVKTIDLTSYSGVTISHNFPGNRVVFNAVGNANAGSIFARHLLDGRTFSIIVASSGRVRIQ